MTINKSAYKRNHGLDILKIVMMLWIILFHMANHSQADLYSMPVSANWLFEALLCMKLSIKIFISNCIEG